MYVQLLVPHYVPCLCYHGFRAVLSLSLLCSGVHVVLSVLPLQVCRHEEACAHVFSLLGIYSN